ncbi:hypothetical protein B0H15DRAFT_375231 [Mycena belliarum]|uniref:Uncharacterized protein n=1 Tax=Mycena belliarum TaxID=1033014 RepID=A0AAD6U1V1_9AGAR|nr:hypothetical protein B0H15DRAFT_375231 [Mycena belliae]
MRVLGRRRPSVSGAVTQIRTGTGFQATTLFRRRLLPPSQRSASWISRTTNTSKVGSITCRGGPSGSSAGPSGSNAVAGPSRLTDPIDLTRSPTPDLPAFLTGPKTPEASYMVDMVDMVDTTYSDPKPCNMCYTLPPSVSLTLVIILSLTLVRNLLLALYPPSVSHSL